MLVEYLLCFLTRDALVPRHATLETHLKATGLADRWLAPFATLLNVA